MHHRWLNVANHHTHSHSSTSSQTHVPSNPTRLIHATPSCSHPARKAHTTPVAAYPPTASHGPSTHAVPALPLDIDEVMDALTETQSKSNPHVPSRGLMFPGRVAQAHPMGPTLQQYGTTGCPAEIAENWTLEQLDQAVAYSAHPSASTPEAATALRDETLEKVHQGLSKLVSWKQLRQQIVEGLKPHTKVSPIAAIPHKSRLFRMILDLSKKGQRRRGQLPTKSVNELTNEDAAPRQSMDQLGNTLGRIIFAIATQSPEDGPLLFAKLDIKDGFWRMCVPEADEEQFCYVLPPSPDDDPDDIMIVVPAALQMGWTSSPAFFCAATETGRDVAEFLRTLTRLPTHPLEHHMVDPIDPELLQNFPFPTASTPEERQHLQAGIFHLFECFVDDYIGVLQSTDPDALRHHSRALLHAIHQIFPPKVATGHDGENPISYKKLVLDGEGIWAVRKEILGWIFDGLNRTMELPPKKVKSLQETLRAILRKGHCELKAFESLIGKCQHACLGIPGGTALLPPLYKALHSAIRSNKATVQIHPQSQQQHAIRDLRTLFTVMSKRPTQCCQLVPGMPAYIGYCDACKYGAGGIWLSGSRNIRPIVWRIRWPPDIVELQAQGKLTINDLEMAGLLLQYLLLEQLVDIKHTHTAAWCDNTSAVSWTRRMSSNVSTIGQQLTRALALRMCANESSHLAPLSIAGVDNDLADLASRSFKQTGTKGNYDLNDSDFLTKFNSDFPLQQGKSWLMLRLHTKVSSLVFTLLRGKTPPTGSWLRLKKSACDIGLTGPTSVTNSIKWTRFSEDLKQKHELTSLELSLTGSVKGMQEEDIRSELARFRQRFAPSGRPLNWTSEPTPSTHPAPLANTGGH